MHTYTPKIRILSTIILAAFVTTVILSPASPPKVAGEAKNLSLDSSAPRREQACLFPTFFSHIRAEAAGETGIAGAIGKEMRTQGVAAATGATEKYLRNLAEAISFRMRMRYRFYPEEHPATVYINEQLKRITNGAQDIRLHLIEHYEELAFSLPNGEIYLSSGMLRMIETEEELLALLMHELRHIESKHALETLSSVGLASPESVVQNLGMARLHEFDADVAMMIELDKRG